MNPVKELYLLTAQLLQVVENEELEREQKLDQINELLDKREKLFKHLPKTITAGEKQVGQQIILMNEKFMELLTKEKLSIHQDLQTVKNRKKNEKKYTNPYQSLQVDGVYYDKKK